jgi:glycosyltransferase involved in cell wall biosynthesis
VGAHLAGYGQQCGLFAPLIAQRYDLTLTSYYGLEGAPIRWQAPDGTQLTVLPGLGGEWGDDSIPQHARMVFGDPRDGLIVTLMDVWVLDPAKLRGLNLACWVPLDHDPCPPKIIDFFIESEAIPIAMSRFGEAQIGRLDPLYVPHGIDTEAYQPLDQSAARGGSFPDDAFVCGIVAANKGRPSRKGFAQALRAFAKFAEHHEDAYLYLHTVLDPSHGSGENISALLQHLQIPMDRIRIADQYAMMHAPYSHADMARIYSAMDVLLNPAWGEGFGIPVLESQSCGVPVVVTDFSAMPEVCGAGWQVKHVPYWTALSSWQAVPDIDEIYDALEECYAMPARQRVALSQAARRHALQYDVRKVAKQYMFPALRAVEQRIAARQPVRIAPWQPKVAA